MPAAPPLAGPFLLSSRRGLVGARGREARLGAHFTMDHDKRPEYDGTDACRHPSPPKPGVLNPPPQPPSLPLALGRVPRPSWPLRRPVPPPS